MQKELEAAKFELEQQRQELVDHFAQTAEMLDTLGKDYTKLYQHSQDLFWAFAKLTRTRQPVW